MLLATSIWLALRAVPVWTSPLSLSVPRQDGALTASNDAGQAFVIFDNTHGQADYKITFTPNYGLSQPNEINVLKGSKATSPNLPGWNGRCSARLADGTGDQDVNQNVAEFSFSDKSFYDMSIIDPIKPMDHGIMTLNAKSAAERGDTSLLSGCSDTLLGCTNLYLRKSQTIGTKASTQVVEPLVAVLK